MSRTKGDLPVRLTRPELNRVYSAVRQDLRDAKKVISEVAAGSKRKSKELRAHGYMIQAGNSMRLSLLLTKALQEIQHFI